MDHPHWCQPEACTAYAQPGPSLRRAHRGNIARIDVSRPGRRSAITTMLIQDVGGQPQVVVTAAGYSQSRMVELGTSGAEQLIEQLAEHVATARAALAEAARR